MQKIIFLFSVLFVGCAASSVPETEFNTQINSEAGVIISCDIPADCGTWENFYGIMWGDLGCSSEFPECPFFERNICPADLWGCVDSMLSAESCEELNSISECELFF